MAKSPTLEYITYTPHRPEVAGQTVNWVPDKVVRTIERLPQIFWSDGTPWREVNLWALEMGRIPGADMDTVRPLLSHLHHYAKWLDQVQVDWRHFPQNKAERVLVRYRGALVEARDRGELKPTTTTSRMNAVIRFYRFAAGRRFVSREAPKWQDRTVVLKYFDTVGFERTMTRLSTDISIPNRARPGVRLEDGLLPLSQADMSNLLRFAADNASEELYLMLLIGWFTGARIGTIATLHVPALEQAIRDPNVPGFWVIPVGPGTGISTKFNVSGDLLIPDHLMAMLKAYVASKGRLARVIRADRSNQRYLFLTSHSRPYSVSAVDRQVVDLRKKGRAAGQKFLDKFRFHQTRATYGTWLMTICLGASSAKAAIEFVKRAMHHKNEATTFGYITFIEHTTAKVEVANAFTEAFLGLRSRLAEVVNA